MGGWIDDNVRGIARKDVPTQWCIEVNQTQLQVTVDGTKALDCEVGKEMSGHLGFWRARCGHRIIVRNLVVERSETHVLQASYDGTAMRFSSLNGETVCEFAVG